MATDLTATTPHDRGALARRSGTAWLATYLPWRTVLLPWIVARVLVIGAMSWPSLPGESRRLDLYRLLSMDGQWFRIIATNWYDGPYRPGVGSAFPFFPLYPGVARGFLELGAPQLPTLIGISWLASLAAMAGAYQLAVRHLPARAAPWAIWFVAIAPGAVTMVMGYSDSLYLAGLVWALVLAEDRKWWAAGIVAAVATAARPNGWIAVVALVLTVWTARGGWRALVAVVSPSAAFLAGWCWYLWSVTGDPFVFYDAKAVWYEVTIGDLLRDPVTGPNQPALFHLLFALALLVPFVMRIREQPPAWTAIVVLSVLPPLVLGTVGLARYAILAFPLPFAAADVLTVRGRVPAVIWMVASGVGLVALAWLIVARSWVP